MTFRTQFSWSNCHHVLMCMYHELQEILNQRVPILNFNDIFEHVHSFRNGCDTDSLEISKRKVVLVFRHLQPDICFGSSFSIIVVEAQHVNAVRIDPNISAGHIETELIEEIHHGQIVKLLKIYAEYVVISTKLSFKLEFEIH